MKSFAILAGVLALGATAFGAYHYFQTTSPAAKAAQVAKEEKAKEALFSYNGVLLKYENAATKGDSLAKALCAYANLGLGNFDDAYKLLSVPVDPASVDPKIVETVFKSGHPFFLFMQGYCHANGLGVAKDPAKAYECFNAAQKLPFAKVESARCLIRGQGVNADVAKGVETMAALVNFNDSNLSSGSVQQDGRTQLAPVAGSEFPPAALALAEAYLSGKGVEQNYSKAMECSLVAYSSGVSEASKLLDTIFQGVYAKAEADAKESFKSFDSSSPEYQAALKEFQAKNKSLSSMPDLLAKETERRMKAFSEGKVKRDTIAACRKAGWILAPNGKDGICLAAYQIDKAKLIDNATALILSAKGAGGKDGIASCREQLKSLIAIAKVNGLEDDLVAFNALDCTLAARRGDALKSSDYQRIVDARDAVFELNSKRPSLASLAIEHLLLACEAEYLNGELNENSEKLQALEVNSPVKNIEFVSREHVRFDGTHKTALEVEADGRGGLSNKRSEARSGQEAYFKDVSGAFSVAINGGEAKNMSREDFGKLKSSCDKYNAEKLRLTKVLEANRNALKSVEWHETKNKATLQALSASSASGAREADASAKN